MHVMVRASKSLTHTFPHHFRTISAQQPDFRTISAPFPHHFRTASARNLQKFNGCVFRADFSNFACVHACSCVFSCSIQSLCFFCVFIRCFNFLFKTCVFANSCALMYTCMYPCMYIYTCMYI